MTQTASRGQTTYPAAGLDQRFYAFALDRVLVWGLYGVAGYLAYRFFLADGRTGAGLLLLAGVVLVLGVAQAALLGLDGLSAGKAATGLRVVHVETGAPIGFGPALLRTLILGVAALPTLTVGIASLAWTAVMDPGGRRRGWHDHVTGAVVVDVRPVPLALEVEESRPRQVVNLTALRLQPTPPAPSAPIPPPRSQRAEPSLPRPAAAPPRRRRLSRRRPAAASASADEPSGCPSGCPSDPAADRHRRHHHLRRRRHLPLHLHLPLPLRLRLRLRLHPCRCPRPWGVRPAGGSPSTRGRPSRSRAWPWSDAAPRGGPVRPCATSCRCARPTCRCPRRTRSSRWCPTGRWS